MSSLRRSCVNDYSFQTIISICILKIIAFNELLHIDSIRKSKASVNLYSFISLGIIKYSLKIKYNNLRQLIQIGPFIGLLYLFLAMLAKIARNLLFLYKFLKTRLKTILIFNLKHQAICSFNFLYSILALIALNII